MRPSRRAGSIAIHMIRMDFVESLNNKADGFGLPYRRVSTPEELEGCYEEAAQAGEHAVLEVSTSIEATVEALGELEGAIRRVVGPGAA